MTKMYCSNCNVAYSISGVSESQEIMCENGHFLCPKCYASSKTKCIKCGGRLFDCIENIPLTQHYTNWTLEMICDWLKTNEKPTSNSRDDKFDGEFGVLRDGESMNMLFSRSKSFDAESEDNNNNSLSILSSKENQDDFLEKIDSFPKYVEHSQPRENNSNLMKKVSRQNPVDQMRDQFRGQPNDFFEQNDSFSKYAENAHSMENNSNLVKNDTRQKLVDQMKDKIRGQSNDFFEQNDSFSKYAENAHSMENNSNLVKNDTRQKLVDQIRDQIRGQSNDFFEQNDSFSKYAENAHSMENNSNLVKNDTRQKLVDQIRDQIRGQSNDFFEQNDSFSKYVENSHSMENNSNLVKNDTRQKLVDQIRDQIRGQSNDFFEQNDSLSNYVENSHSMENHSHLMKNDTRQKLVDQMRDKIRGQSNDLFEQNDSFSKYVENSHSMENNSSLVKNDTRQKLADQMRDELRMNSDEFFEQIGSFANSQSLKNNSNLGTKDTRQNLLDQMKDEISEKVKEQIYNLYKNDPRTLIKPVEEYMRAKESKTIGVSTESEPNIAPRSQPSKERIVEVIDLKPQRCIPTLPAPPSQEYLVMNVDAKHKINPKPSSSGLEEQHQEASETLPNSGLDMILSDKTADKFSTMPQNALDQKTLSICNAEESQFSEEYGSQFQNNKKSNDFLLISNSSRASYSPPSCLQISSTTQPKPQFQLIANATKPLTQIVDAISLFIPRSPVICPISSCQQACFVSDITRHVAVYHTNVPMERIVPRQCKNFFLDPKLIHLGSSRCQMLLLVNDKIKNLGHEKRFKDFIPILVMSTKVSTLELCCRKSETENAVMKNPDGNGLVMIWLTGLMPPQLPIYFSMTVWARTGNSPSCHIVHSGQLYSIRNSQNARDIQESGQRLLLSRTQIDLLTSNGRNMLELQIAIN
ncbi:probable WRKY transcription factor protein 1 [Eupeodes corollae]|uniref:probable WRKY transcription factor protein 1 n=1 Tax=Eupeodes corollae TaxID=290404 RepID=UPI00249072AD|nr:probable WRKY transcription factor protein 1 [Eupeodes corollae]